jgi:hypothetical protein
MSDESSKPIFNPENPITVPLTVRVNIDYVPVLIGRLLPQRPSDVYWREQFSLDRVPTLIARRNLCRRRDLPSPRNVWARITGSLQFRSGIHLAQEGIHPIPPGLRQPDLGTRRVQGLEADPNGQNCLLRRSQLF